VKLFITHPWGKIRKYLKIRLFTLNYITKENPFFDDEKFLKKEFTAEELNILINR